MADELTPAEQAAADAVRQFHWDDYGLDDVDPNSEYAEWVEPLSRAAVAKARPELYREVRRQLVRCVHPSACAAIDDMIAELEGRGDDHT